MASPHLFQGGGQIVGRGEPCEGLLGTRDLRRRRQQLRQQRQEVTQRRGLGVREPVLPCGEAQLRAIGSLGGEGWRGGGIGRPTDSQIEVSSTLSI